VISRRALLFPFLVLAALGVGGCGSPDQVTYVDPNGNAGLLTSPGGSNEPVRTHGIAALERAKAITRIRAALTAARTLRDSDAAAAASVLDRTIGEDLSYLEPRVAATDPGLAASLRGGLERLRDDPPDAADRYAGAVKRLVDVVLPKVEAATVGVTARQDAAFRADVLYETLNQAGSSYENAFDGGLDGPDSVGEYRLAYGLAIDASTRQVAGLPDADRPAVRRRLDELVRSSFPAPTPPPDPRDPEDVLGDLTTLADEVAERAGIDPTFPPPDANAPDQLRSLKRAVAASVEAVERGATEEALQQLAAADRSIMAQAASSIAAVSPELLTNLEQSLLVDLPESVRGDGDVASVAVELDTRIDEAISLLEEELQALRDSG